MNRDTLGDLVVLACILGMVVVGLVIADGWWLQ